MYIIKQVNFKIEKIMKQVLRDFLKKISWNIPRPAESSNQSPVKRPAKKSFSIMGFSLVELLTTVGILSVVSTVAIPIYSNYKNSSKKAAVESVLQEAYDKVTSNQLFEKDTQVLDKSPTELSELNQMDMVQAAGAKWKRNSALGHIEKDESHWCLEIKLGKRAYNGEPSCINGSGEMSHKETTRTENCPSGDCTGICDHPKGCKATDPSCPPFHSLQSSGCVRSSCPTGQRLQGSGSSASCVAITCPTGQRLNGNTCEAITCPQYYSLQGSSCVRSSCPIGQRLQGTNCVAITCPTGQRLNGNTCEAITCSTGQRLQGSTCVAITCSTGERLQGNNCVPLSCAANERIVGNSCVAPCPSGGGYYPAGSTVCVNCPSGTYSDRFECVACASPKIWDTTTNSCLDNCPPDRPNHNPSTNDCECPTGQRLQGSSCEPITCPTGQRLQGSSCEPITCPTGQRLQGSSCEPITCPTGQRLQGNTCVATCPSWQILQGSNCVPRDNIQSGDCPQYHSTFFNSEAGKNDCKRTGCPPGERLTFDHSACIPCAAGERVVNRFYCVR